MTASVTLAGLVKMRSVSTSVLFFLLNQFLLLLLICVLNVKQQARFFFQQLISGVNYCHAMVPFLPTFEPFFLF